jgi:cell division protein FtsL
MNSSGIKLRSIVMWMALALLGASLFSAHVYKQNLYVRLSRDAVKMEKEKRQQQNELASLELEVKSLMRRQRLENLAINRFGLVYAGAPEPIYRDDARMQEVEAKVAMASFQDDPKTKNGWVTGAVRWLTEGL